MITIIHPACPQVTATFGSPDSAIAFIRMMARDISPESFVDLISRVVGVQGAQTARDLIATCLGVAM